MVEFYQKFLITLVISPAFFLFEVPVPSQESERSCICVLGVVFVC